MVWLCLLGSPCAVPWLFQPAGDADWSQGWVSIGFLLESCGVSAVCSTKGCPSSSPALGCPLAASNGEGGAQRGGHCSAACSLWHFLVLPLPFARCPASLTVPGSCPPSPDQPCQTLPRKGKGVEELGSIHKAPLAPEWGEMEKCPVL